MQDYILEIPGYGTLQTYNNIDVSFNYSFQDLSDINSRVSEFSKTVPLPSTYTNDKFFQQIFELTISNSFNANKRVRCNVRIGDANIFKGYLKLEKIVKNLEDNEYEVTILSIAKNLTEQVGDTKLDELDFTEWNHNRNKSDIKLSWDTSIYKNGEQIDFQLGRGYVYPKIVYGNATDIQDRFYTYDAFPALYVKTIWDKIFQEYGYTYTSNFLQSEYFNRLIIPFSKDKLELNKDAQAVRELLAGVDEATLPAENSGSALPYQFKMQNGPQGSNPNWVTAWSYNWPGLDDESTLDFSDPGGQWDGGTFTCAKQGWYDINFNGQLYMRYEGPLGESGPYTGNVQYTSGQLIYYWEMYLQKAAGGSPIIIDDSGREPSNPYGQLFFAPSDNATHASPWIDYGTPLNFNAVSSNTYLEPGDTIFLRIKFRQPGDTSWGGSAPIVTARPMLYRSVNGTYTTMSVKVSNTILMGDEEVNMQQVLPNMKTNDFLEGIIQMFALSFNPDPEDENNLIIEPSEVYLKSKPKVKDWSKKLDRESYDLTPTANVTSRRYLYTYSEDSDYFNEQYTDSTNEIYGQLEVTTDNDFNTDDDVLKLPFSPTPDASSFGLLNTVQPFFVTINDANQMQPKSTKPRILFYGGLKYGDFFKIMDSPDELSYIGCDQYPYVGTWDDPVNPRWDLSWGSPKKIYWESDNYPTNNLFNQFHKNQLEAIVSEDGRILTGDFFLSPNDIEDIDPRDIIYIDGSHWRILNVKDYNPVAYDRLTEVELLKIIDFEEYQTSTNDFPSVSNACPVDLVITKGKIGDVYASPSGQPITADCCASVGGKWSNGACLVSKGGGVLTTTGAVTTPVLEPFGPTRPYNGNAVNALDVIVKGKNNTVNNTTKSTLILGDYNGTANVQSGMITGDRNSIESATKISILGDSNFISSSDAISPSMSSQIMIVGNNNTVEGGISGVNIFGNNIIATTGSTLYSENLNVSGSINGVPITTLITGSTGLPGVLSIDSASGANNIVMDTTQNISSANGSGKIELDAGGNIDVVLISAVGPTISSELLLDPEGSINQPQWTTTGPTYQGYIANSGNIIIQSVDNTTTNYSSFNVTPDTIGLTSDDIASQIIDNISVDPQGLNNGTGITSEDYNTGDISYTTYTPNSIDTAVINPGTNQLSFNMNITPTPVISLANDNSSLGDISSLNIGYNLLTLNSDNTTTGITDTISVDPEVLGNGTGILSSNTTTGEVGNMLVGSTSVGMSVTGVNNSSTMNLSDSLYQLQVTDSTLVGTSVIYVGLGNIDLIYGAGRKYLLGGRTSTANNTPTIIKQITPSSPNGIYTFKCITSGLKNDASMGYSAELNASFRVSGSAVTQISTTDSNEKTEFTTATSTIYTDGTDIIVEVTGETATTINWKADIEYNY